VAGTFLLLLFYALSYGVWGLVTLALWERRAGGRQVFIRCFFFFLVFLFALFFFSLYPVAFLFALFCPPDLPPPRIGSLNVFATAQYRYVEGICHRRPFYISRANWQHRFSSAPLGATEGLTVSVWKQKRSGRNSPNC